jgi:hypothetical protein
MRHQHPAAAETEQAVPHPGDDRAEAAIAPVANQEFDWRAAVSETGILRRPLVRGGPDQRSRGLPPEPVDKVGGEARPARWASSATLGYDLYA